MNLLFYSPDENKPEMDWTNYLTIILFMILIFLGIFGSILSFASKSKSLPVKFIQCFSFYDNAVKIITIPKSHEN